MRFVVCNEAPATGRSTLDQTVRALAQLGEPVVSHVLGPDGIWQADPPVLAPGDWLHVGTGGCLEEPASSVLRQLISSADGGVSWHVHLPVSTATPDDCWEPVEAMLAAIGTQGGVVFLAADEVAWLCQDELVDAGELAEHWAAEHGLALVVVHHPDGGVEAVKPDGRRTPATAPASDSSRAPWQVAVATFLAAWVENPAELDTALAAMTSPAVEALGATAVTIPDAPAGYRAAC